MPSTLPLLLAVALGGSAGALARFGIYSIVHPGGQRTSPWTTFAINIIGCAALGLLLGWSARRGPEPDLWRTFLSAGVLGAFTTFSAYSADALRLLQSGRIVEALLYVSLSAAVGLGACAGAQQIGLAMAR